MPEDINKILELARPSAPQPAGQAAVSRSARVSRVCGFLVLGSVILFWLVVGLFLISETAGGNSAKLFEFVAVAECCLLPCLSITAVIAAIVGLVGARRHHGNGKAVVWAIVLTVLAVAGFMVPIYVIHSRITIHFW